MSDIRAFKINARVVPHHPETHQGAAVDHPG
jgi:hypothetical protein